MSSQPSLRSTSEDLLSQLDRASGLLRRSRAFEEPRRGRMRRLLSEDIKAICELSFLSAFLSWENFLENSFTLYMMGKRSPSGFHPDRFVLPTTVEHAFDIIAQGRKFADWVQVQDLRRRSQWYFRNGEPFASALLSAATELDEMRLIRHRIAHMSTSAHRSFEDVVRRNLGSVPRNVTPGSYLLIEKSRGQTYFDFYVSVLKVTAVQIIPQ